MKNVMNNVRSFGYARLYWCAAGIVSGLAPSDIVLGPLPLAGNTGGYLWQGWRPLAMSTEHVIASIFSTSNDPNCTYDSNNASAPLRTSSPQNE